MMCYEIYKLSTIKLLAHPIYTKYMTSLYNYLVATSFIIIRNFIAFNYRNNNAIMALRPFLVVYIIYSICLGNIKR